MSNLLTEDCMRYTKARRIRVVKDIAVGDELWTDWWTTPTKCRVVEVCSDGSLGHSESGLLIRVETVQGKPMADAWYDSHWFGELT